MLELDFGQVLTQIIGFLIMLWVLKRFAWKPLLKQMAERTKKIQGEFDDIEHQKKELKAQAREYDEKMKGIEEVARSKIQEAVDEARTIARTIETDAHAKANAILEKGQEEIERERIKARIQLKNDLVTMTIAALQKIVPECLDDEKQKKIIAKYVEQVDFK